VRGRMVIGILGGRRDPGQLGFAPPVSKRIQATPNTHLTVQAKARKRKFYIVTVLILVAVIGSAAVIVEYVDSSYVSIEVIGSSHASLALSYDSTSVTLSASENATVEVLPHASLTVTADPVSPYTVVHWDVSGPTATQEGQNSVVFQTGQGGGVIHVSAELATNSSG
jgi:hypothetical protein